MNDQVVNDQVVNDQVVNDQVGRLRAAGNLPVEPGRNTIQLGGKDRLEMHTMHPVLEGQRPVVLAAGIVITKRPVSKAPLQGPLLQNAIHHQRQVLRAQPRVLPRPTEMHHRRREPRAQLLHRPPTSEMCQQHPEPKGQPPGLR